MDEQEEIRIPVTAEQWQVLRAMEFVSWAGAQLAEMTNPYGHERPGRNLSSNEQRTRDAALFCLHEFFRKDMSGPQLVVVSREDFDRIRGQEEQVAEADAPTRLRELVERAKKRGI